MAPSTYSSFGSRHYPRSLLHFSGSPEPFSALFFPSLSCAQTTARYAFGHGGTVGGGSPTPRRGNAPGTPSLTCPHRSANAIACSAASTVAELRRAEQPPPPSSPPRWAPVPNKRKVLKTKRTATLGLAKSRRQGASRKLCRGRAGNPPSPFYCCEKRITISTSHCIGGHHCPVDRLYQVSVRCGPRRHRAVADTEMTSKKKVLQLSPGLPGKSYLHWAVQPDPTIGEPFLLGVWKMHLLSVARRHQAAEADPQGTARKRAKPQHLTKLV